MHGIGRNRSWPLVDQREYCVDGGIDLDGDTIQKNRLVFPLADGFEGRLSEQIVTRDDFRLKDLAVRSDDDVKTNGTLNSLVPRFFWINGRYLPF